MKQEKHYRDFFVAQKRWTFKLQLKLSDFQKSYS